LFESNQHPFFILVLYETICLYLRACLIISRAPVLVALALIELGMKYEDAVELIRELVTCFKFHKLILRILYKI